MKNICLSVVVLGVVLGCVPVSHGQIPSTEAPSPGSDARPATDAGNAIKRAQEAAKTQARPATTVMGNVFDLRPTHLQHSGVPVKGTLFDPSGAPAPGVLMCVLPVGTPESDFKSDAAGQFTVFLQALPFGGPPPGYQGSWGAPIPEFFLLARDLEHNLVALVQIQKDATNLDAHLQPGLALSGSFVDGQGAPVKTATLRLDAYPSPMWPAFIRPELTVDEHGAFGCRALPRSHVYYLTVIAPGFEFFRMELGTNQTQTTSLQLPPIRLEPAVSSGSAAQK